MTESPFTYLAPLLLLLGGIYVHRILYFYAGLTRLEAGRSDATPEITVVVPARNEEETIVRCLASLDAQEYPNERITVIVVDDGSTDRTAAAAKAFAERASVRIIVVPVDSYTDTASPKVRALMHGIQRSSAPVIATTDADCMVPRGWLRSIASAFDGTVGVVTGVTLFGRDPRLSPLFAGVQLLDFLSYTSIAAGAVGRGRVLVANGSNMAFLRSAFDAAGGFERLRHINTGDDSLLAQSIVRDGRWSARFLYGADATVETAPAATFRQMLHQRFRWVGQTAYYPPYMMFFMISTFILYILLFVSVPMTFLHWSTVPWLTAAAKFGVDFLMMRRLTALIGVPQAMRYFAATALVHIPFVLVSTVGGYFLSFEWKERTMTKEAAR
ncbi:MAG: glycosyltransferase [Bacteroidetes bacterium]|nr:MAG: glycosyltransferase [Bacteroidota bacterium]